MSDTTLIRVFPTRTRATPTDDLAFWSTPDFWCEADEVHISVTFTWDMQKAERLAKEWGRIAPVTIGGPGTGQRGEVFVPGRYVAPGYTITSRGCPNRCWFCSVPKRDGSIRELPIRDGWNVLDDNLLACSEQHIRSVFAMLRRQTTPIEFTGGWEAARLADWHVDLLTTIRLGHVWFAYDTPDDYEPLVHAGRILSEAGIARCKTGNLSHTTRCYCLCGYPKDTFDGAEARLRQAYDAGFLPMAMLWRNERGERDPKWRTFQRLWARPTSVVSMCRKKTSAQLELIR